MKHILPSLIILGVTAMYYEYRLLGGIILLFVALMYQISWKATKSMLELYDKMPTVWLDITETIEVGQKHGMLKENFVNTNLYYYYAIMEAFDKYFELKVDNQMINSFEEKYYPPIDLTPPIIRKGLFLFTLSKKRNPHRLPEIVKGIMVRKKVRGNKRKIEPEISFKPAFH